ncbi:MAG: hypothetical protein Q9174_006922, partial [Haloplaca sp. 1 TL-2023]
MPPLQRLRSHRGCSISHRREDLPQAIQRARRRSSASESDYGEEIIPTLDETALSLLPKSERKGLKQWHRAKKRALVARWQREGKRVPEHVAADSPSGESSDDLLPGNAPRLPDFDFGFPSKSKALVPSGMEVEEQLAADDVESEYGSD